MSEQQRQHLSALVDDELEPDLLASTVSATVASVELSATWERYHLIGGVLRGESVRTECREVGVHVTDRLRSEPALSADPGSSGSWVPRSGPLVGIGLAAAAAFFAVFAVPQLFDPGPNTGSLRPSIAVSDPPALQPAHPVQRWSVNEPALERKLDRFLMSHQALSPVPGIKGFIPYATVVGYEAGR